MEGQLWSQIATDTRQWQTVEMVEIIERRRDDSGQDDALVWSLCDYQDHPSLCFTTEQFDTLIILITPFGCMVSKRESSGLIIKLIF